jgi:hypothetical protein
MDARPLDTLVRYPMAAATCHVEAFSSFSTSSGDNTDSKRLRSGLSDERKNYESWRGLRQSRQFKNTSAMLRTCARGVHDNHPLGVYVDPE